MRWWNGKEVAQADANVNINIHVICECELFLIVTYNARARRFQPTEQTLVQLLTYKETRVKPTSHKLLQI
jgi:hypothetical protein